MNRTFSSSRSTVLGSGAFVISALAAACSLSDGAVDVVGLDGGSTLVDSGSTVGDDGGTTSPDDAGGTVGTDGGQDLPDAGAGPSKDGGVTPPDAGLPVYTFATPLAIDLSGVYNVDAVASGATNGDQFPPLVPVDGSGYCFLTRSYGAAPAHGGDTTAGLPDNGQFAADGTNHPKVTFAWRDNNAVKDAVLLNVPPTSPFTANAITFNVPAAILSKLQLYFTSTEGSQNASIRLTYSDSTAAVTTVNVPDWSSSTPGAGVFVLASGLGRHSATEPVNHGSSYALFGTNVVIDPTRTLASVTVQAGSGNSRLVLFGATAY